MASRISKLASSLKQLGEIQVTEFDFMELLNKDIRELEIGRSLRKLGNVQVMEWDFRDVLPAVSKLANQEVDLVDLVKRTAHYKVLEWDFRDVLSSGRGDGVAVVERPAVERLSAEAMQELVLRLKDFLQYVVVNLIDQPGHAQIKVLEIAPNVLRFQLVMVKRDVAMLIGREGHTATAIRNILKAVGGMSGVHVLLQIHSQEEAMRLAEDFPRGGGS